MRKSESTISPNTVEVQGLVDRYATTLRAHGYRPSVVGAYSAAVEHFVSWAGAGKVRLEIGQAAVRRFLIEHLSNCNCQRRVQRGVVTVRAALNRLLAMFSEMGQCEPELKFAAHVDLELRAYGGYASDVCGLAPATLISRRQWIGRFLADQFPKGRRIEFSLLRPKHIRDFFTTQCQRYRPGTAQVVAGAVRSYLRFRAVQHADGVESLLAAVPSAAHWRLAALPDYLEADEITTLMAAFDRQLPQHQRDYAIVRCLVDLGLRSCEVAALSLDDIDWKTGTLTIRVGKAQRADVLPLPSITGTKWADIDGRHLLRFKQMLSRF